MAYTSEEDSGSLCCSRICLFILGAVALGVGWHMVDNANLDERRVKIEKYDSYVREWNSHIRSEMAGMSLSVTAVRADYPPTTVELVAKDVDMSLNDQDPDLLEYVPLKYVMPDGGFLKPLVNFSSKQIVEFAFTAKYANKTSYFSLKNVDLTRLHTISLHGAVGYVRNKCASMHGKFLSSIGRQCQIKQRLHSICVEIKLDTESKECSLSFVNDDPSRVGCGPVNSWLPGSYVNLYAGNLPAGGIQFDDFQLSVRHAADPLIQAEIITGNTLAFGMSKDQQKTAGIVLLVLFPIMWASPLLWCYWMWKEDYGGGNVRYRHHLHESDEDDEFFQLAPGRISATSRMHRTQQEENSQGLRQRSQYEHNGEPYPPDLPSISEVEEQQTVASDFDEAEHCIETDTPNMSSPAIRLSELEKNLDHM